MAKKAKKAVKKAAPKAAPKKSAPGKPAAKSAGKPGKGGMFPVTTGTGATPLQVGNTLVKMFNEKKWREIEDFYWTPETVSCEGEGVSMEWRGRAAAEEKNHNWMADHVIHSAKAEGPYVGATGFAVKYTMEVETKSTAKKETMVEVGVYTIRDGKIAREEFMYYRGA